MQDHVLIVEDERDLLKVLSFNFEKEGFDVVTASNGATALKAATEETFDLILLDLMLPDISGTEVCRRLKQNPKTALTPVIMVTAKGEEVDRVVGFELGADDYVVKPFSVRELILRCRAILRRRNSSDHQQGAISFGVLRMDAQAHRVWVSNIEIALTALEFKLLNLLIEKKGRVLTRELLLDEVWGHQTDVTLRNVDTHVKRLREKMGEAGRYIETVRGVGYRFSESATPP